MAEEDAEWTNPPLDPIFKINKTRNIIGLVDLLYELNGYEGINTTNVHASPKEDENFTNSANLPHSVQLERNGRRWFVQQGGTNMTQILGGREEYLPTVNINQSLYLSSTMSTSMGASWTPAAG